MIRPTVPPPTLRIGLALGAVVVVAAAFAWSGMSALRSARVDLALLESQASLGAVVSPPLLGEGELHPSPNPRTASASEIAGLRGAYAAMLASLREQVARRRLLVERLEGWPLPAVPGEIPVAITVSGSEADVFEFVRAVETARPTVRFARWRVARTGPSETAIRFEALAVGYWAGR